MQAWEQFLLYLERELGSEAVQRWVRPLKVARFDAGNLYLETPDTFQLAWFEEHVRPFLKEKFVNPNTEKPIRLHFLSSTPSPTSSKEAASSSSFSIEADPLDESLTLSQYIPFSDPCIPLKLLSELITGSSPFNPIYLYGPKNSGKTHLLMGVTNALKRNGKRVFYVRAETFTEHVVQAIRLGIMQDFRKIYRDIDVLVVDDIHTFSKKNATQEEFFHTFNTLHTLGRLVLLSSQVPPSQLREIEPRLISRFEWGIVLNLEKADPAQILKKKAALWKVPLTQDLLDYLLEQFGRDPLMALQALALRFQNKGTSLLNLDLAKRLLRDLWEEEQKNAMTPDKIIKAVAAHYGIKGEDLIGKSQLREVVIPRQVAMYLCRHQLKLAFQKIGEIFERDHSTVMASIKRIQKGIEDKEKDLVETLSALNL